MYSLAATSVAGGVTGANGMRICDLYPYWNDMHQDLLDLLDRVDEETFQARPGDRGPSVHQMALALVHEQRFSISALLARNHYERARPGDYPDIPAVRDLLIATWQLIDNLVAPLTYHGLRAVRTYPAQPQENQPETNVSLAWLIWHAVHQEIYYTGQIAVRLADYGTSWGPQSTTRLPFDVG